MAIRLNTAKEETRGAWTTAQVRVKLVPGTPNISIKNPQTLINPNAKNELASILANLYPDDGDQQRLLFYIGIDSVNPSNNYSAINMWTSIVEKAQLTGSLYELIDVVLKEYPDNTKLLSVASSIRLAEAGNNQSGAETTTDYHLRNALRNLIDVLAYLYSDSGSWVRLVSEATLDPLQIDLHGSAIVVWYRIIERAFQDKQIDDLLDIALSDYPENDALREAKQLWIKAKGEISLTIPKQQVQNESVKVGKPPSNGSSLTEILANLYLDGQDQRRIVEEAGLNSALLNFYGAPIVVWSRILQEAQKRNKVDKILDIARQEYPNHPLLKAPIP